MATLASLHPLVAPEVPGCPAPLIDHALREAARKWCTETWRLRADVSVATVPGQRSYALTPPADTEVVAVASVWRNNDPLDPLTDTAYFKRGSASGAPFGYLLDEALYLYPVPNAQETLTAELVLQPTMGAASIDDKLLPHRLDIALYAKQLLWAMKGQPWSDAAQANRAAVEFRVAVTKERIQRARGRVNAQLAVRPPMTT